MLEAGRSGQLALGSGWNRDCLETTPTPHGLAAQGSQTTALTINGKGVVIHERV